MQNYNLHPWILECLKAQNINKLTLIQQKAFQSLNTKTNFIGISPTGTGKTLAYVCSALQLINFSLNKCQSVIVCPTRELANQVFQVIRLFKPFNPNLKIKLWIGGKDLNKLINDAKTTTNHLVVCTPERFLEVAKELPDNMFDSISSLVLDEADMMMDLNFWPQIKQICQKLTLTHAMKIAMSATLHNILNNELKTVFQNTKIFNLNKEELSAQNIQHVIIKNHDKNHALLTLLRTVSPYFCLIFTNTNKKADEIYKFLLERNFNVINLHSGLNTRQRKNNFTAIKNLKYQYVVASDLFSRGMDIDGASHIISYDIPNEPQWYIHRAGRTGRSKYTGISYLLYTDKDQNNLQKIKNKKINFVVKQIKNNELVDGQIAFKTKNKNNLQQENEIKHLIASQPKKVKPNHKKKLKQKIHKIKQKHKRTHIENKVKKQLEKKYRTQE